MKLAGVKMRTVGEMEDDPRGGRAKAIVDAFLQHEGMEQRQDYLVRGRRFADFDVRRLNAEWVLAVRRWLARKSRSNERTMDDLAAELRLRGFDPPYADIHQQLMDRAQVDEVEQERAWREFARKIVEFTRRGEGPLH